jgi:hypothetical protein
VEIEDNETACGTMIHPFIDCMLRFRELGIGADDISGHRKVNRSAIEMWDLAA